MRYWIDETSGCLNSGYLFPKEPATALGNPAKSIHATELPTSKTPGLSNLKWKEVDHG